MILKGKKLGFTLTEISEMVEAQAGRATQHGLKLTAEKCVEQIAHFERQIAEATEALAELRRIHALFRAQIAEPQGRAVNVPCPQHPLRRPYTPAAHRMLFRTCPDCFATMRLWRIEPKLTRSARRHAFL